MAWYCPFYLILGFFPFTFLEGRSPRLLRRSIYGRNIRESQVEHKDTHVNSAESEVANHSHDPDYTDPKIQLQDEEKKKLRGIHPLQILTTSLIYPRANEPAPQVSFFKFLSCLIHPCLRPCRYFYMNFAVQDDQLGEGVFVFGFDHSSWWHDRDAVCIHVRESDLQRLECAKYASRRG